MDVYVDDMIGLKDIVNEFPNMLGGGIEIVVDS